MVTTPNGSFSNSFGRRWWSMTRWSMAGVCAPSGGAVNGCGLPGIGADLKVLRAVSISDVPDDLSSWESLRLSTDRLCLHPPTARDAEALYELFADGQVMDGLGMTPISALDEAEAMIEGWIDSWRTDGLGAFVFENPATHRVVGQAGLMVFDTRGWTPSSWANAGGHAQPELGWALLRRTGGRGMRLKPPRPSGPGPTNPAPSTDWSR